MFGAHRLMLQTLHVRRRPVLQQAFHRRADAIDDRAQITGLLARGPGELLQGCVNGAAVGMAQHHHQARAESLGRELDAAHLRRGDDVAGNADDEQVAQPLIKHDLRGHARVGATEDDGERLLADGQLAPPRPALTRLEAELVDEAAVAVAQGSSAAVPESSAWESRPSQSR